jgi:DNA integrity scanning protein DisA with diadenylate cyclase activity
MLKGKNQSVLCVNKLQTGVPRVIQKNRVEFEYRFTLFGVLTILNRIMMVLLLDFRIFSVQKGSGNNI